MTNNTGKRRGEPSLVESTLALIDAMRDPRSTPEELALLTEAHDALMARYRAETAAIVALSQP